MTREEAIKIIENNRPIYRDWQEEFDEALDRLKQPITLSEFLWWEESPDYCPNCGQAIDWSEE